jgi:adenosine 3'-phospho 5'-phosphosulfate transporter B3
MSSKHHYSPVPLDELERGESAPVHSTSSPLPSSTLPSPSSPPSESHHLKLLCWDLSSFSPALRFLFLSVGVFFFFLLNSFVEELMFKGLPKFQYGWYLTFFELLCFAGFAMIERYFIHQEPVFSHSAEYSRHGLVALAMTAARGLTNVSLQYLNYPTQVIFKSMKLITVMIGSLLIQNKSFSLAEYISAFTLVLSACLFSLGDIDTTPTFSSLGILIVSLSLVFDAIHSNTQETLLKFYKSSNSEMMLFTNLFSAILCFLIVVFTNELLPAIDYCYQYPFVYGLFVIRALVIYFGVLFFLLLIRSSGVVTATAVTTVRKILSILLSFVFFPKAWTQKYALGLLVFIVSVGITLWDAKREKKLSKKGDNDQ